MPLLSAGLYRVEIQANGFGSQQRPEVRLEVGQTARVDFTLTVGSVTESIVISASATLLQTENTDVGQVIDSKRIVELPLNGRNYLQLAQFTAGVQPGRQNGRGARSGDEGTFFAMGMSSAQNNVLLDGNDNSSRLSGGPLGFEAQAVKTPVDAVAEFKVVTNNVAAEYGFRAGAKVLVLTKSGTNQFHGAAFEFFRNEKLDATNFFANRSGARKPTYRQNQFGGVFGLVPLSEIGPSFSAPTKGRASAPARTTSPPCPAYASAVATSHSSQFSAATSTTRRPLRAQALQQCANSFQGTKACSHPGCSQVRNSYFLVNGNVPNHHVLIRGRDEAIGLRLSEAESEDHSANVTVLGSFDEDDLGEGHLRRLIVFEFVRRRSIAKRAFALSTSDKSTTAEQNWLRAEQELLEP